MKKLSATEKRIIKEMLIKRHGPRSAFLDQYAAAFVKERRLTGVGIFIDLGVPAEVKAVDQMNEEISAGCRTTLLKPPGDLVGFTLFIRDGYLGFLEGYTFGAEPWPDELLENGLVLDSLET